MSGARGSVWVFHPNGAVLFREPSTSNPIGESALKNPLFQAAQADGEAGTLRGPLAPDGDAFISGFRRIATPPVIVAVSLHQEEVLADWYHERNVTSAGFAVLGLTLGLTVSGAVPADGRARPGRDAPCATPTIGSRRRWPASSAHGRRARPRATSRTSS